MKFIDISVFVNASFQIRKESANQDHLFRWLKKLNVTLHFGHVGFSMSAAMATSHCPVDIILITLFITATHKNAASMSSDYF